MLLSICPTPLSFPHNSVYSQTQRHLLLENLMKVIHTFPRKMLTIFHRSSRVLGTHWWDHCSSLWWVGGRGVPYSEAAVTGPGTRHWRGPFCPRPRPLAGTYLLRRENRNVVFIYDPRFLFNHGFIHFFLQLLARHPEEHVLLAELGPQKLPEGVPARGREHELVKGLSPGAGLLQGGTRAGGGRKGCGELRDRGLMEIQPWTDVLFPPRMKTCTQALSGRERVVLIPQAFSKNVSMDWIVSPKKEMLKSWPWTLC